MLKYVKGTERWGGEARDGRSEKEILWQPSQRASTFQVTPWGLSERLLLLAMTLYCQAQSATCMKSEKNILLKFRLQLLWLFCIQTASQSRPSTTTPSCITCQCPFPSGMCFMCNNPLLGKDAHSRDCAINACKMKKSLCCITSTVRKEHGHAPVRPWALEGRWWPLLCSVQARFKGLSVLSTQLDNRTKMCSLHCAANTALFGK